MQPAPPPAPSPHGPGTVTGHASAGGAVSGDVEFLNRETGPFLDGVTEGGKRMN